MTDWKPLARALSNHLSESGHLRTPDWQVVFAAVPRHEFIAAFFEQGEPGQWRLVDSSDPDQRDHWLTSIYSNTTLVTTLEDVPLPEDAGYRGFAVAVSSSTEPALIAQMLEDLDVHPVHDVLEIGTGTGYNAALLCERLGENHVHSVDLRPDVIDNAAQALARLGYHPTLAAADGANGLPGHGPFDRIIATCSVQFVPPAWIEQLRPGGKLLADIEGTIYAGNLAELHRQQETVVEGRFNARYGSFMAMEHQLGVPPGHSRSTDLSTAAHRTTTISPTLLHERQRPFRFYAQLHLPPGTQLQLAAGGGTRLIAPNGSWCEVHQGDSGALVSRN